MPNRENVVRILREQTHDICFNFPGPSGSRVRVDHSTFVNVADAIESTRIVLDFNQGHLDHGACNMYRPQNFGRRVGFFDRTFSGVMVLDPGDGTFAKGGVVHESVHASLDLPVTPGLMALENEAAAYIAEDLYYSKFNYQYTAFVTAIGHIMRVSRQIAFRCGLTRSGKRRPPKSSV